MGHGWRPISLSATRQGSDPFVIPGLLAMFSIASCIALFSCELLFIICFYDPNQHTSVGVLAIFAAEMSFFSKVATSNLAEKKRLGKVSNIARGWTAVFGVGVLGLMALALGFSDFRKISALWILFFALTACGKIGWLRYAARK
jgi:hypothetical protein